MPFSIDTFLRDLTHLPHRGAATRYEPPAIELLSATLQEMNADVRVEPFRTPRTYVTVVYWLIGSLLVGLLTVKWLGPVAVMVEWAGIVFAWLYFNWRYVPVGWLPPWATSHNVIGRWGSATNGADSRTKVILMAHYDTAPVSLLYRSSQVKSFRSSLVLSLFLMLLAGVVTTWSLLDPDRVELLYVRGLLAVYFILQAILSTLGFWLYGYTNGASDNATGVAAALATAERLRQFSHSDLDIEVVLTGAEEAGMIGSRAYIERHRHEWPGGRTAIINFDTLGNGTLHVIERTGTLEIITYDNPLMDLARELMKEPHFRGKVSTGRWHMPDLDSVWFVRAGMPVITLCALDGQGQMPNIHRPEDQLLRTDLSAVSVAVDFALKTLTRFYLKKQTVTA